MKQQRLFKYEGDFDEHSDGIVKLRADIAEAVRAGDDRRGPPKKKRNLRKKRSDGLLISREERPADDDLTASRYRRLEAREAVSLYFGLDLRTPVRARSGLEEYPQRIVGFIHSRHVRNQRA